jgi:hypothetical protein
MHLNPRCWSSWHNLPAAFVTFKIRQTQYYISTLCITCLLLRSHRALPMIPLCVSLLLLEPRLGRRHIGLPSEQPSRPISDDQGTVVSRGVPPGWKNSQVQNTPHTPIRLNLMSQWSHLRRAIGCYPFVSACSELHLPSLRIDIISGPLAMALSNFLSGR